MKRTSLIISETNMEAIKTIKGFFMKNNEKINTSRVINIAMKEFFKNSVTEQSQIIKAYDI